MTWYAWRQDRFFKKVSEEVIATFIASDLPLAENTFAIAPRVGPVGKAEFSSFKLYRKQLRFG